VLKEPAAHCVCKQHSWIKIDAVKLPTTSTDRHRGDAGCAQPLRDYVLAKK